MTSVNQSEAHVKLTRVFRYLQALNLQRNPPKRTIASQPWIMWFHDLPDHPCIRIGAAPTLETGNGGNEDDASFEQGTVKDGNSDENFILKISRPQLTPPPEPPAGLIDWLQNGWQRIDGIVAIKPTRMIESATIGQGAQMRMVRFEDDPQRQLLLAAWKGQRDRWLEAERPAYQAMSIFEKLYALEALLEREGERLELVLGNGILRWQPADKDNIHHPILLMRLQLQFDPSVPELTLTEADRPPELYSALFQAIPDVNPTAISRCREDLDQGGWHPLGGDETAAFLRRVVVQLSPYGQFGASIAALKDSSGDNPSITLDPLVFLRHRTLGFNTALEAILADLPQREELPEGLKLIVGIDDKKQRQADDKGNGEVGSESTTSIFTSPNGEDEHILLSKPANAEQLEIARKLEREGAVLVQGPPGTGKTHTIANLLGHLLSQGKSVLITSHTAKALTVLRHQVVEPLQPLCVSVLNDSSSNKELAYNIDAITERLANASAETLEREAASLTQQRLNLLQQLRETRQHLSRARYDEYREVVVSGQQYTPAQAAREIVANQESNAWIPAPVKSGEPLPLSEGELVDLYHLNITVTPDREREMIQHLPEPAQLLSPDEFTQIVEAQTQLQTDNLDYRRDLWHAILGKPAPSSEPLIELQVRLSQGAEILRNAVPWQLAAIEAGRQGGPWRKTWDDLIAEIEATFALAGHAQPLLFTHNPIIRPDCLPGKVGKVLDEITAHLTQGGKLNTISLFMHRDWKTVIEGTQVRGEQPVLPEHFEALQALLQLQIARANLVDRWERQMIPAGGLAVSALGAEPEKTCHEFTLQLRQGLDWHVHTWLPLEQELVQQGFQWQIYFSEISISLAAQNDHLLRLRTAILEQLPLLLHTEINRRQYAANQARLSDIQHQLEALNGGSTRAEVIGRLLTAVRTMDILTYHDAYQHLTNLLNQRQDLQRRYTLLTTLESSAPAWAAAIREREGIHGTSMPPGDPVQAWLWRQLYDELERRAATSLEELQEQIARLSIDLQHVTAELVEKKAWAAQVRRTTLEQQQALQGWKLLMKRIGKGTGKRAPRYRARARELMAVCQTAVPVWIMPLSRAAENFDPHTRFDVVIIDEASQSDAMALTAIYMADQVIVVGDDEQVSPMAIGQTIEETTYLIDENLKDIRNAELYDGKLSIYDLAKASFAPVCLREHFRCVSPIIQFSNHLSYQGKIKPLRDDSEVRRQPPTIEYRVQSNTLKGEVNEEEAQAVASLLVASTKQPKYKDATFGVISMVSKEQTILRIDELLRRHLSTEEYVRRRIQCGNAGQFQGDERDVIFLTLVDVPKEGGPLPLREYGPDDMYKKRFNVAASRARDQMWVVHSLSPDLDLKPNDIRRKLIEHARDPLAFAKRLQAQEEKTDSEFERLVLRQLMQAGYRVTPQWPVGAYRIDLVVEGGGKRLAIECDGDRWHPQEKLEDDIARQAILERLGWRFVRIRGSQFFRNPDKAMQLVFARLNALEIPPQGMPQTEAIGHSKDQVSDELKERIIRNAAELRQQWATQGEELVDNPLHNAASKTGQGRPHPWGSTNRAVPVGKRPQGTSDLQVQVPSIPNDVSNLVASLQKRGYTVIDRRDKQGGIWVVGGNELTTLMQSLATRGFPFKFYPGGVASQNASKTLYQDGWYMKSSAK